ncbi:MAG: sulfotransferase, partial [Actinobacteria bacterium]|nr:sulfotransferase [Actinomycetota bacterium]
MTYDGTVASLVYIAGYGRSGSTILERLLARDPRVLPTGELYQFFTVLDGPDDRCSCGSQIADCPFWEGVYSRFRSKRVGPLDEWEPIRQVVESARWRRGRSIFGAKGGRLAYGSMMREVISAIEAQLPPGVEWITDSSKSAYETANRPTGLHRLAQVDVSVIHLIRDVRAVMWSEGGRGSNLSLAGVLRRRPLGFLTAFAGWISANRAAGRLNDRLGADRYLRVRYEDLVLHPEREMPRIGAFLGLDVSASESAEAPHHQLAGNRARFAQQIVLEPDLEWEDRLPWFHRLLAVTVGR